MTADDTLEPDEDALGSAHLRPRRRGGSGRPARWLEPTAAAVAVLLAGTAAAVVVGHRDRPSAASRPVGTTPSAACPASYVGLDDESTEPWVPARPVGVDTGGRLVPDITPASALVCSYTAGAPRAGRPSGGRQTVRRHVVTGDLADVRTALTWLPPARSDGPCAGTGLPSDDSAALVRLAYPGGGMVWVAAPGHACAESSNGTTTVAGVYASVATAVRTGSWPGGGASDPSDPCGGTTGRFGQERAMVPRAPTGATVCTVAVVPVAGGTRNRTTKRTAVAGQDLATLVTRLDAVATARALDTCSGERLGIRRFEVRFVYAVGPPVSVRVDVGNRCFGDLSNGTLRSSSTSSDAPTRAVLSLVNRLTR